MKHIIIGFFIFLLFSFTPKVEAYDYRDCEYFLSLHIGGNNFYHLFQESLPKKKRKTNCLSL